MALISARVVVAACAEDFTDEMNERFQKYVDRAADKHKSALNFSVFLYFFSAFYVCSDKFVGSYLDDDKLGNPLSI